MPALAFVNGKFLPLAEANISILDRGFLFADGIYEVCAVINGRLIDHAAHMARLQRSLKEIALTSPVSMAELTEIELTLSSRNNLREGLIYLQITRGADHNRDFPFPAGVTASLVLFVQHKQLVETSKLESGLKLASVEDLRWKRRDIKSVALLAQVLARQAAVERGCDEAVMVEEGMVTECSSSSLFIVGADGSLIVRPLGHEILPGVTRLAMLRLAEEHGVHIETRRFSLDEAYAAQEMFITSASALIMPVTELDNRRIGDGKPGPVTRALRRYYLEYCAQAEPRISFG